MKITKDSEGNEHTEWEGVDWFWANLGSGLLFFLICIGVGGCMSLGSN